MGCCSTVQHRMPCRSEAQRSAAHLILHIHLVKLVDAADAVVGQHERACLDAKLVALALLQKFQGASWLVGARRRTPEGAAAKNPSAGHSALPSAMACGSAALWHSNATPPPGCNPTLTTVAVRPAADELLPLVYTARGRKADTYLRQ